MTIRALERPSVAHRLCRDALSVLTAPRLPRRFCQYHNSAGGRPSLRALGTDGLPTLFCSLARKTPPIRRTASVAHARLFGNAEQSLAGRNYVRILLVVLAMPLVMPQLPIQRADVISALVQRSKVGIIHRHMVCVVCAVRTHAHHPKISLERHIRPHCCTPPFCIFLYSSSTVFSAQLPASYSRRSLIASSLSLSVLDSHSQLLIYRVINAAYL